MTWCSVWLGVCHVRVLCQNGWSIFIVAMECNRKLSNGTSFSDLEWLSKIFNDTKHHTPLRDSWASCSGCIYGETSVENGIVEVPATAKLQRNCVRLFLCHTFVVVKQSVISHTFYQRLILEDCWWNDPRSVYFCPVSPFLSASLYVSKRGAYWDRLCRDVVGWLVGWSLVGWSLVVGCHARPLWLNGAS